MEPWVDDQGKNCLKVFLNSHAPPVLIYASDKGIITVGSWAVMDVGYAGWRITTPGVKKCLYLHRIIANAPKGIRVDHKNLNKFDCRRSNLRLATGVQNCQNVPKRLLRGVATSKFKGVWFDKKNSAWCSMIRPPNWGNKRAWLGRHKSEIAAARAYNAAAKKYFGEFAYLNAV